MVRHRLSKLSKDVLKRAHCKEIHSKSPVDFSLETLEEGISELTYSSCVKKTQKIQHPSKFVFNSEGEIEAFLDKQS